MQRAASVQGCGQCLSAGGAVDCVAERLYDCFVWWLVAVGACTAAVERNSNTRQNARAAATTKSSAGSTLDAPNAHACCNTVSHTTCFSAAAVCSTSKCVLATSGMQADMLALHALLRARLTMYEHDHGYANGFVHTVAHTDTKPAHTDVKCQPQQLHNCCLCLCIIAYVDCSCIVVMLLLYPNSSAMECSDSSRTTRSTYSVASTRMAKDWPTGTQNDDTVCRYWPNA